MALSSSSPATFLSCPSYFKSWSISCWVSTCFRCFCSLYFLFLSNSLSLSRFLLFLTISLLNLCFDLKRVLYFTQKSVTNLTKFSVFIKTNESYWKLLNTFLCFFYRLCVCPISSLNKSVFRFTKVKLNVHKLTNFNGILFTWTSLSQQPWHLSELSLIRQTNSQLYICMSSKE